MNKVVYQLCYVLSWRALTGTFTWLLLPAAVPGPHPAEVQQAFRLLLQEALLLFLAYFQAGNPLCLQLLLSFGTIALFLSFIFSSSFFVEYKQESIFFLFKDSLFVFSLYLLVL